MHLLVLNCKRWSLKSNFLPSVSRRAYAFLNLNCSQRSVWGRWIFVKDLYTPLNWLWIDYGQFSNFSENIAKNHHIFLLITSLHSSSAFHIAKILNCLSNIIYNLLYNIRIFSLFLSLGTSKNVIKQTVSLTNYEFSQDNN